MTDTPSIDERIDRVESIIDQLESGDVTLGEARALRDEAREHIEALYGDLDVGEGTVTELEE